MTPLDISLLCMATWRLSHLIAVEDGPVDVFKRWRDLMGAMKPVNGQWQGVNWWSKLWVCPLCLSLWIAPTLLFLYSNVSWFQLVAAAIAISGASSWLELAHRRGSWR